MSFTHLDDVLAEVQQLGQLFVDAGFRIFLVGGIVRDQLIDEPLDASSDIDLTTDALPADIKRIVAPFAEDLWTQGEKFGTIGLRADGRDYEITTHRAESYTSDSRKPVVSFGDSIDVDLSRRDFTVNAMAIELPAGELVDPFDGASDLQARQLRTPLSADVSFSDDPLRMLRAARFATKFDLAPDAELAASATDLHQRVRIVAIERIGVELRRLLGLPDAQIGLRLLAGTGVLAEVLAYSEPERIPAIAPHLDHAIEVAAELQPDWRLRLAGMALATFGSVDEVGQLCERLRLAREHERYIVKLSRSATAVVSAPNVDNEVIRRWLVQCEERDMALELAEVLASEPGSVTHFRAAVASLVSSEKVDEIEFLDGETIMSVLDVPPGRVVGDAQKFLRDCYFREGPQSLDEQRVRLVTWAASAQDHR